MPPSSLPDGQSNATDLNKAAYATRRILGSYKSATGLTVAETILFARHADPARLPPGGVLDIGIGAGRTCKALSSLGRPYTGLDFVPEMVAAAKRQYPALDLRVMDARNLDAIPPASIALAVFSFNGIDSTGAEFRARVLSEIARVLVPGGLFIFSSHNLAFKDLEARVRPVRPRCLSLIPLAAHAGFWDLPAHPVQRRGCKV